MRKLWFTTPVALLLVLQGARIERLTAGQAAVTQPENSHPSRRATGELRVSENEAAPGAADLRQEIERLKQTVAALEQRLAAQEKKAQVATAQPAERQSTESEMKVSLKQLDRRLTRAERDNALHRVHLGGDYRFEAHSILGDVPAHYDGMKLQNLLVKSMFTMNALGRPPGSVEEINRTIAARFSDYQFFSQNLSFDQIKGAMERFPASLQQQLFGMLMPSSFVPGYKANNKILYTNRFRLRLDSRLAENVSVTARLSMYKVFGDSTGVQVFNGQPNTLNIDGTTSGVPNSDILRVDRAYFTWNKIGNSPFFLSIGRRPSTEGPPLEYREDEPRAGTPSGALINYQFDGMTFGYHLKDHTTLRLCYGLGYESGFGSGDLLKLPQDRLKDVHFIGANIDLWNSDDSLVQLTVARTYDVTDGFNGLMVLPNNPITGDPVSAPVVMRFTPSSNLGAINLAGINLTRKIRPVDVFVSANYVGLRPNGKTTPFGGLGSDPFERPVNRDGGMIYVGARYNFPNDERTKVGFEYNRGSKYWFNFAHAEDDIIAPKTATRGDVFETFLTHRINSRFIFKTGYIHYNYRYSGSGWHLGAPKKLNSTPLLGFPTYKGASMLSLGLMTRF
ncbi:MAG: DUF3373 family protein [Acidobacteria bacterium]|nr:DUF3373 family protein [Acidobacteriota bacterium]